MDTTGNVALNLADIAKRMDPNSSPARIIELLNQTNDVLKEMSWIEGNLPTGHRSTVRTGLPAPTWRLLNGGVAPSKSTTAQIDEACGMLEAFSTLDVDVAKLSTDVEATRLSEAMAFLEGMNQEMAKTLIYGDTSVNPEKFLGLAPRFNTISGAVNGVNVISGGGSGSDNTSIWLVVWGPNTVTGIYPKGSDAGIYHEDIGIETGNGSRAWRCAIGATWFVFAISTCRTWSVPRARRTPSS